MHAQASQYTKWEHSDELKLKQAVEKYGNNWDAIHKFVFPERGAICLKNKYYTKIHQNKAFENTNELNKSEQMVMDFVRKILETQQNE
ncbi:Myb-like_DNA-binding domain-containing protein [Hexamita inflata]|uniref:Myb-like DNA-binding domain-containing protein n=1 Tax=Hexamita inflata TaxID=28002 RepID=A0AA86RQ90_9EUKA|nr:Myb-like DNA-binding domain-containing protein [Hexamita inflata]